jgi:hypothetical protein
LKFAIFENIENSGIQFMGVGLRSRCPDNVN